MLKWRAIGFAGATGALILTLYLPHPIVGGHGMPLGPDGPVYIWWTRYVDAEGLWVLPGRLGIPGAALVLGAILGTEPLQTIALVGPVLAVATGLGAAAVSESLLGPNLLRSGAAAVLAAGWAAHLAAGYLGSLALVALFLAGMASLGRAERSWRAVVLGGTLLGAGGLSHRLFLFLGLAILAGAVLGLLPDALRSGQRGTPILRTAAGRVTIGALAGTAAGVGLSLVMSVAAPRLAVDTSQDSFLRRHGLGDLLRELFRERLGADARRTAAPIAAGVALGAAGLTPGRIRGPESRFFLAVCGSWGAVTLAGVVLLAATGGPANRLLTFAFFIPLLAAVGFDGLIRRGTAARALSALAGLAIIFVSMLGWYRQPPFIEQQEVEAVAAATKTIQALPSGTPLVFLVDTTEEAPAFHVTRFGNVIRSSVPQDRIADVHLAVGQPEDYLAGRPTLTGDVEHDRLSVSYRAETRTPGAAPAVLVLRAFNPQGYPEAARVGSVVAPGAAVLQGPSLISPTIGAESTRASGVNESPGVGPVTLAAFSILALVALGLLGAGWARWGLPGVSGAGVAAAAPSVGVAILILGAVAAEGAGVSPGGPGGMASAVLIGASGYAAAVSRGSPK